LVSEQHKYSLLCREPELEVLPSAKHHGIGVVAWSPLAGGLLGENALNPQKGSRSAQESNAIEAKRPQLERFAALCKELGESQSNVGLAWVLANPALTAPIIGPRTQKQFENSLRAVEIVLAEDTMDELNNIFPGPGKPAPEAYAW
jgi:aryl-alcohol dehydrogenase-like predicted oxidoreductase